MRPIRKKHSLYFEPLELRRVLATITVTTVDDVVDIPDTPSLANLPGPDGVVSLREAFLVANEIEGMDTVEFDSAISPGVIQVTDGNLISYDPLRVSGPGSSELTIDLNGNEMHFIPPAPNGDIGNVEINGLEIINGHRAIRLQNFGVSIVDTVFRDNDVAVGSFNEGLPGPAFTTLNISNSVFENNRGVVGGFPESLYPYQASFEVVMSDSVLINTQMSVDVLSNGSTQITRSRMGGASVSSFGPSGTFGFTRVVNSVELGGVFGCSVDIRNSEVTGNVGGFCDNSGHVTVAGSTITGNVGRGFVGPTNFTSVTASDSAILGRVHANSVTMDKSWATNVRALRASVRNSTITGGINIAFQSSYSSPTTISNSTIFPGQLRFFNYDGGGAFATIQSSIVSNIVLSNASDIHYVDSLGNNIFGSVDENVQLDSSDLQGVSFRLSEQRVDASGKRYYTPLLLSPAIDAGVGTGNDQLGNFRNNDGDGDGIRAADIGAIESPTMFTVDRFAVNFAANPTLRANVLANDEGTRSLVAVNNLSSGTNSGEFGTLNWDENGDFSYTVDTANPAVAALPPGETLEDAFVIRVSDGVNESEGALYITLSNDTPVLGAFFPAPPIATQTRNDDVDLGDLDGDGDLDAFITVRDGGNQVWLNDGTGHYVNSGQSLGNASNIYADLADLDNDGDLDAVVAALDRIFVWSNVGSAQFELRSQYDVQSAIDVTLDDFDSDGDQDLFVAQLDTDLVFLNDGSGNLIDSGQRLGNGRSKSVEMGDVDGDGDLDAVIGATANPNGGAPNHIWLNNGNGIFTASPHSFGNSESQHVALGDLDGDGDLDAISANAEGLSDPNVVWLNDGLGRFTDTGRRLGNSSTSHIALADLDDDGDLDAYAANWSDQPDILWFNDGLGTFTQGQSLGMDVSSHVAMGDIDGDSRPDAVVATFDIQPVVVWKNRDGDMSNDLDGNSVLNSDDLDHLCVAIRDGINEFRFDIDENGIIDQADLLLLQSQLQIGFGDITADGVTDVSDFAVWNVHKFSNNDPLLAGVGWSTGDLNCDGVTDIADFNIWNQHKFTSLQRESPAFDVSRLANPNDNDSDSRAGTASVIDQVFRSQLTQ